MIYCLGAFEELDKNMRTFLMKYYKENDQESLKKIYIFFNAYTSLIEAMSLVDPNHDPYVLRCAPVDEITTLLKDNGYLSKNINR